MSLTVNTRENELGCELYISNDKEWYDELHEQKEEIESSIGESLEWMRLDEKKASRIKLAKHFNFDDQDKWPDYFEWLKDKADKFKQVFGA